MKENQEYVVQLRKIKEQFGFDFCSMAFILEGPRPLLTWVYATGNQNHYFRKIVLESGKGIAGKVYKTGRVLVIQDVHKELTKDEQVDHPISLVEDLRSMIALPLWQKNKCTSILLLAMRSPNYMTPERFEDVMTHLCPKFCDFEVRYERIQDAMRGNTYQDYERAPVYELINYPVLQAREDERRRIARDLHDSVVQSILGVQLMVRNARHQQEPEHMHALLGQADEWLTKIQDELRSIATSLRPASLDDLGLIAALHSYFMRIETSHQVKIHFKQNVGNHRYTPDMETTFYRVCQEATRNSCKYAKSPEIEVSLFDSVNYLTLQIKDFGRGFDVENPEILGGGMGILDMHEWTDLVDGELTVQSKIGQGTLIRLTAPIQKRKG